MKTVIILSLMFILNMAYANNETTSSHLGEKGYIQGSLVDSWEQHFTASLIETTGVHPHSNDPYNNPRQGIYFKGSINPILHAPNPQFALTFLGINIRGDIPYNSKVLQSAEGGIGFKKDNLRVEGVLKWNRFHTGTPQVHSVDFTALPMMIYEDLMMYGDEMMILPDDMSNRLDNLGFLGKVFYDWDLAGAEFDGTHFYVGSGYGLLRSSGPITGDWTSIITAETGLLIQFTRSTDIKLGYEYTFYGKTEHGPVMVDSYERHSAVVGFHLYRKR